MEKTDLIQWAKNHYGNDLFLKAKDLIEQENLYDMWVNIFNELTKTISEDKLREFQLLTELLTIDRIKITISGE